MSTLQIKTFKQYQSVYKQSVRNPEKFWAEQADTFLWHKKWDKVLEWDFKGPDVKWFSGGKLNIVENCLDRHLEERADKLLLFGNPTIRAVPIKLIPIANCMNK